VATETSNNCPDGWGQIEPGGNGGGGGRAWIRHAVRAPAWRFPVGFDLAA
jgi:hypothetical protein